MSSSRQLVAETFLTIPEVAKILRLGSRTTYELARTHRLGGAVKIGHQWRVERSAFSRWVEGLGRTQVRTAPGTPDSRRRHRK